MKPKKLTRLKTTAEERKEWSLKLDGVTFPKALADIKMLLRLIHDADLAAELEERVAELERDLDARDAEIVRLRELLAEASGALMMSETCQDEIDEVQNRIRAALSPQPATEAQYPEGEPPQEWYDQIKRTAPEAKP